MLHDIVEDVYGFIGDFIKEKKYSPSLREIAEGCYISTAYVMRCLDILETTGRLTREPGKARSIRILEPGDEPKQMF
jgi:SOS-response transcriptional repressor LexA